MLRIMSTHEANTSWGRHWCLWYLHVQTSRIFKGSEHPENDFRMRTEIRILTERIVPATYPATQCRMLHLLSVGFLVLCSSLPSFAVETQDSTFFDVLTAQQAARLEGVIKARTIRIRRTRRLGPLVQVPGGDHVEAYGWLLGRGRVLTASQFVDGWPSGSNDLIEVWIAGKWVKAAVGLSDYRKGLAVLDVGLTTGRFELPLTKRPFSIVSGRMAFGLGRQGGIQRFRVGAKGKQAFSYYLTVKGRARLGMPLVDARGRLLTLVGLRRTVDAKHTYVLPLEAFEWLVEKKPLWSQ